MKNKITLLFLLIIVVLATYIAFTKGAFDFIFSQEDYAYQHVYDSNRDASEDLKFAKAQAEKGNKKIFMIAGGYWCPWCRAFDKFIEANKEVKDILSKDFIILKVYYGSDKPNSQFFSNFPRITETPQFYILDSRGSLMHVQKSSEFEQGNSYNPQKVFAYLKNWAMQKPKDL